MWTIEIDRELAEPDPTVAQRQRAMDRAFYTPDGLCPAEKMSSGSAFATLLPASTNADQPSSGHSVQLTVIACGCGDDCAQGVAYSLHGEGEAMNKTVTTDATPWLLRPSSQVISAIILATLTLLGLVKVVHVYEAEHVATGTDTMWRVLSDPRVLGEGCGLVALSWLV